jgi:hypothetical protein
MNIKISILTTTIITPTLNKISNSAFRKKTAKNSSSKKFRMSIEKKSESFESENQQNIQPFSIKGKISRILNIEGKEKFRV